MQSYLESNIVCNYSSLTSALCAQQGGATSVCKNKREKKSARVTLCILTCFCKSCFFIVLFKFSFIWDAVLALGYFNSSSFHSQNSRMISTNHASPLCVQYKRWCVGMYRRNISTTRIIIIQLCCQIL